MPAPETIIKLCETFADHRERFRSGAYNEAQLRQEFLGPFFKCLGWDMDNAQGLAPQYRDVIHEDALKIGMHTKAPDYAFTIHGQRKFFLEAKKPSVNIKGDIATAYQLRRYAWSAKLPLSILSDFEEFAIYDTRVKPAQTDPPSKARTFYCTSGQYPEKWDDIAAIFSRDAILRGSFDKYADSSGKKKGAAEVDAAFLGEIERWRDLLARNFALRNPSLSVRDLNFSVQKTIDRLVFLRICEDRGTEDYARLLAVSNGANCYARLIEIFRRADERYNSGLFHFSTEKHQAEGPDTITPELHLDDRAVKDIIGHLYYPESPYEFSVLPADILGSVYERFLGKTIRLTDGHQAKIGGKPEVRKAGGVYYTPAYIVAHIVRNTLGCLLGSPDHPISLAAAAKLKVADIACGSGSFLIQAYQFLLDWHRDRYLADPEKFSRGKSPTLYPSRGGEWRLTSAEKKRILLANIHGVDIDAAAVEVTKLSLLLKVLEGETDQIQQRDFLTERLRILPDLATNIRCGNSLVGPDFYDGTQMDLLDDDARLRVNVFDWHAAFPEVFRQGGFDCIVGNPPYVLLQADFRDDDQLAYFRSHYNAASYKLDTYHLFMEKAIGLLALGGRCALITPSNYLGNNFLEPLRRVMLETTTLESITVFDYPVFPGVSVDTAIFVAERNDSNAARPGGDNIQVFRVPKIAAFDEAKHSCLSRAAVLARPGVLLLGQAESGKESVIKKFQNGGVPLGRNANVNFGKQLRNRAIFTNDVISVGAKADIPTTHVACITGSDVMRFDLEWKGLACLNSQEARRGGCWEPSVHNLAGKLVCRQIGKRPFFGIDLQGLHCLNTVFMVSPKDEDFSAKYLLGILNSELLGFFWEDQFFDQRKTFPKIRGTYLKELPIRPIDFSSPGDVARHDRMVALVGRMLEMVPKRRAEKNPQTAAQLDAQIAATDRQIDRLVYELYGLTDEEVRLVEGA
ncbi:MAG: TaqI-like C-terminal specificity domain-containing protein [Verrucomicrobiae bacterium]